MGKFKNISDWLFGTEISDGGKATFVQGVVTGSVSGGVFTPSGGGSAGAPSFSQPVNAKGQSGGMATYVVNGVAYAGYVTPTDLIVLQGSASKTIVVTSASMQIAATASATQVLYFIKRTTANTGGTATNPAAVAIDSQNAAATGVVSLYTAAPTTGSVVGGGNVAIVTANTTAAGAGAPFGLLSASKLNPLSVVDLRQGITLRGVGESLALNWNGAALPAGFAASFNIEWVEY